MKRFCKGFLLLLCLALLLSACARKKDTEGSFDGSDVSESPYKPGENGYWDLNDLVWGEVEFPVTGLYGVPHETLLQAETPVFSAMSFSGLELADFFLFELIRSSCPIPFVYDKSTGRFSYACSDPLCTHEHCIWSNRYTIYSGGDELFLIRHEGAGYAIYSSGVHGENPRKLYESADWIGELIKDGDYLYFLEQPYDKETDEAYVMLMRVSILGKTSRKLLLDVSNFLPLGDRVLYVDAEDWNCYFYDIEAGEKTLFEESCYLVAAYGGWIYYDIDGTLYRALQEDPSVREQILTDYSDLAIAGDRLYYARSEVFATSEEFNDYFRFHLYSSALDGSDEKPLWDLGRYDTNGIPVSLYSLDTDGKLLHIEYETYRDFRNMYNPTFGEIPMERGDRYDLLIDLSTGAELPFMGTNSFKYKY